MAWDEVVVGFYERELGRSLGPANRTVLTLPGRAGGCGLQSALAVSLPAYLGSWELSLAEVASVLGANTAAEFHAKAPATAAILKAAESSYGLQTPGSDYRFVWERLLYEPAQRRQHLQLQQQRLHPQL